MMLLLNSRYKLLRSFFIIFIINSFFLRAFLTIISIKQIDTNFIVVSKLFIIGFLYDIITAIYYFLPLIIYLLVIPQKIYNSRLHKLFLLFISFIIIYIMVFSSISEYFFWEEFGKRFNFIAVDYLVYTQEVIKNIQESYPLNTILSIIFFISISIMLYLKKEIYINDNTSFFYRLKLSIIFIILSLINFNIFDKQVITKYSSNIYNNELAKNGIYSFFSAFRHNELDYDTFYKTMSIKKVFINLRKLEGFDNNVAKIVKFNKKENKKNIILIMVESLSAKYLGIYGNKLNLTPHLDQLAKKSLFFNNLFATGTRTVRGMEAVNLSVPPTPGRSIIKRTINDTMDSFGKVLKQNGYENKFIYAGYGYFDNMNDFYSKNGFKIVDRLKFKKNEITFANAWGACDGDLFNKVLKEADKSYQSHKPFFFYVMTTSNHRPYTYPDGKIDIPSHTGRTGAVKYTDFAINEFIKKAKTRKWFNNTVFVIIADHNGGSAGKMSLPLYRYKIPLIIYSPTFIQPKIISKLSSQIDTMPTLLSLLNIDYQGKFYGNNILDKNFIQRAFIGNYQKLGYVKDNFLYYLTPDKLTHKDKIVSLSLNNVKYKKDKMTQKEIEELITYYQSASYIYKQSLKNK